MITVRNRGNAKQYLLCSLPVILIMYICLYHLKDNLSLKIVADEYGYWANGAYFSGLDWSEITAYNPYYGYGYGIILGILLKIGLPSVLTYQSAIIINGIFLCGIYLIALRLVNEFSECREISLILKIGISFAVTVYTGNLYYTQYTMSEVLLALTYWGLILNAYMLLKKVNLVRCITFIVLASYGFIVHQRTIGVCFICLLF